MEYYNKENNTPNNKEDNNENNERPIWEEFNLTEEQWDAIASQLETAEEESNDLIEYCKRAFPTSVENQVKAFIIATDFNEWQNEEETEEPDNNDGILE